MNYLACITIAIALIALGARIFRRSLALKFKIKSLITWHGTIDRGSYAAVSLCLLFLKYNLDRLISVTFFKRPWALWDYFNSNPVSPDWAFYMTLAVVAAPFAWAGACLTIQRLRSAGLSP